MPETQSAAAKAVAKNDGWTLGTEQEPKATTAKSSDGSVTVVKDGNYVAYKRDGITLIELQGSTPEELNERIEAWEAARPTDTAPNLSEEMLLESARATAHMAVTAGARVSYDVDLTPAGDKPKASAANVSSSPEVKDEKLSKEDAELVAAGAPAARTGKVDGVGGVGPAASK